MAHLHRCACGRQFRCEGVDHPKPAWYWCDFQCPDRTLHGFGLYHTMDAEFLRFCDVMANFKDPDQVVEPAPSRAQRRRELRCRSRAQGQREHGGS
jgi:hypothetical protein